MIRTLFIHINHNPASLVQNFKREVEMHIIHDILNFFYPRLCEVCGRLLNEGEEIMCSWCFLGIPRTGFHRHSENAVTSLFWGRVYITHAASWFQFGKGSPYQKLIHKLKYEGRKDIGEMMGIFYARELKDSVFEKTDVVVPVPLHWLKQRKRGYNQSEIIALGICEVFEKRMITGNLIRMDFTDSQTKKSRFDRYLNMEGKFIVYDPEIFTGLHVLLVDDVVTTGSTLEACAQALLNAGCGAVSIITIAVA